MPGAHCYEFFAGAAAFAALAEAEPGTFYLTDFLLRHFDRLVIAGARPRPPPGAARRRTSATTAASSTSRRRRSRSREAAARATPSASASPSSSGDRLRRPRHEPCRVRRRGRGRPRGQPDRHLLARHPGAGHRPARARNRKAKLSRPLPGGDRSRRDARRARAARISTSREWKRSQRRRPCSDDIEREAAAEAARIEAATRERTSSALVPPRTAVDRSRRRTRMTDTVSAPPRARSSSASIGRS